uniref:NADH-ubiquinone oxidoreductase chain 4L n=1 Tax=Reinia sieboldtii TaxID=1885811 RepID=A0A224A0I5_9EUPU|nr:NADH dehydrogenase subunit 4L [Reinia sieboldtii]
MFFSWTLSMLLFVLALRLSMIKKHYINVLIVLKAQMVLALIFTLDLVILLNNTLTGFLTILTFVVCEAALGLSLLFSYIKSNGSDMINQETINAM